MLRQLQIGSTEVPMYAQAHLPTPPPLFLKLGQVLAFYGQGVVADILRVSVNAERMHAAICHAWSDSCKHGRDAGPVLNSIARDTILVDLKGLQGAFKVLIDVVT